MNGNEVVFPRKGRDPHEPSWKRKELERARKRKTKRPPKGGNLG